ncbi:hypothetical protein FS837_002739 [Tulasnella sp. UAMH 9824]|nr:hypothetical protein FS837_002739 [Tulasnella sp. UAMH 9824]
MYARIGNRLGEAKASCRLGAVYCHQSKHNESESFYEHAREIYARIGDGLGEAEALCRLAEVYRHQSKHTDAESSYEHARDIYARIGDGAGEAKALYDLGELYRHQSKHTEAASCYAQASYRQSPRYLKVNSPHEHSQGIINDGMEEAKLLTFLMMGSLRPAYLGGRFSLRRQDMPRSATAL